MNERPPVISTSFSIVTIVTICLSFSIWSCGTLTNESQLIGKYISMDFENNFDTIYLMNRGEYYRKVYNKHLKLVLEMKGQWTLQENQNLVFHSFYLNNDDNLEQFPYLAFDTLNLANVIVELNEKNNPSFCTGFMPHQFCYVRISE